MATVLFAFCYCYDRFYMCFVHIGLPIKGLVLDFGVFANLYVQNVGFGCSSLSLFSLPHRISCFDVVVIVFPTPLPKL